MLLALCSTTCHSCTTSIQLELSSFLLWLIPQDQPGILELQLDDESEVEAAELLLKCCYSITDVAKPLQGATQATLLKVRGPFGQDAATATPIWAKQRHKHFVPCPAGTP